MRLRVGRPRCVLIVAPHSDDEAIGAYGLIGLLRRRGVAVHVLVVTDGAASHPFSKTWPRARLIRERQRETRREMRRIGVAADCIAFLGLSDGGLSSGADLARVAIGKAVRRAPTSLLLIGPARTDDHPDHRIVARALDSCRAAGVRRLAYPVWPAGVALSRSRTLILGSQARLAKRRALQRYRTQAGRIVDDPSGFAMSAAQIAAFSRPAETFAELRG